MEAPHVCLEWHFLPICVIDDLHCTGPTKAAGTLCVIVLGVASMESIPNGLDCNLIFETDSNFIASLDFTK